MNRLAAATLVVLTVLAVVLLPPTAGSHYAGPHRGARPSGPAPAGGAGTDPSYRGPQVLHRGPVEANPGVVLVYWGPAWSTGAFQLKVEQAEQAMFARIPGSPWGAILGQYGVNNDVQLLGSVIQQQRTQPGRVTYREIQRDVQRASVQTGVRPRLGVQWIVFLPPTANLANFSQECGEHDNFTSHGNTFVYVLVQPFDTKEFGTGRASCVQYDAYGRDKVGATTSLTSHEFAEAATDPLASPGAWWGNRAARRFGQGAAEVADFCYAQGVQPWGADGPTVQALWSNRNAGPMQKRGCVQTAAGGPPQLVGQTRAAGRSHTPARLRLPAASPASRHRLQNS